MYQFNPAFATKQTAQRGRDFNRSSSHPARGGSAHTSSPTSRGDFRGRPSSGGRPAYRNFGNKQKSFNDHSKFINKAVEDEKVVEYKPKHLFTDFAYDEKIKKATIKKGYITPSPIQDQVIPYILEGKDVVGIANTGTGKTAAFLLPLIDKVLKNPKENMLIMAPTRELAQQIEEELKSFTFGMGIFSVCCVGGAPIGPQIRALKYHNNFVIGTPGRLNDLIEKGVLSLSWFKTVVLDEADRMLDMGFINDMRSMLSAMPKPRHTLFFSATLSTEIEKLIHEFLSQPVRVSVKTRDTAKSVDQDVVRVTRGDNKVDVLHDLLTKSDFKKVLIFGKTKHGVERLEKELNARGFKAESIHGDKNQSRRQRALDTFKKDQAQVLVATDVAARGLDISDISHVINFDLPSTYEDYIHRIGRTGRGGKKGKALTFVD
jgi:superfamily II DNA/RNA helicase